MVETDFGGCSQFNLIDKQFAQQLSKTACLSSKTFGLVLLRNRFSLLDFARTRSCNNIQICHGDYN